MRVLVFISLLVILLTKYLTSKQMARLTRRLEDAKSDLEKVRIRLKKVQQEQDSTKEQETLSEERIRHMKDLIQDLQARLAQQETREGRIAEAMGEGGRGL